MQIFFEMDEDRGPTVAFFVTASYLLTSCIFFCNCKPFDGSEFLVYTTEVCPRNLTEWQERSFALNCTRENAYMCLPNANITELLEFCYSQPQIQITKGLCMFLYEQRFIIDAYNCSHFIEGCPNTSYHSKDVHKYQSCVAIANGCFLAEPKCIRITEKQHLANSTTTKVLNESTEISQHEYTENGNLVWKLTLTGMMAIIMITCCILEIRRILSTQPKSQPTHAFELDNVDANGTPNNSSLVNAENDDHGGSKLVTGFVKSKLHADRGANIRLTDLIIYLGKHFPPKKFKTLKEFLIALKPEITSLKEANSALECMTILKDQELFSPYDILFLQLVMHRTDCFDLNAKCIEYAEKLDSLCFYKAPPGKGCRNVKFHIRGNMSMYTWEDIGEIKCTVAAIVGCKVEDVEVAGARPSKSFILVLSIKEAYIWKLLALTAQERLAFLKLKIDYLIVDARVIYIESSKEICLKDMCKDASINVMKSVSKYQDELIANKSDSISPTQGCSTESSNCTRGNDIKGTPAELEVLSTDTENVKNDIFTKPYERDVVGKSLDDLEDKESFTANIGTDQTIFSYKESPIEKAMFDQWKQDDCCFISTKACEEVEKMIKTKNLVIVAGHSGSGKSAIIQHIALQYREQGWFVKRVKKVDDILNEYSSSRFQKYKTICVFNNPFGKEFFDEISNTSWQTHEEDIKLYLKTAKLLMSCRNHIISDTRLTRFFFYQSHIVDIDDYKNKLTVDEKRQILTKYTTGMNLSDKECDKIVEVETYFPLLCKLYSTKEDYEKIGIRFFTEPVTVLREEILGFRTKDRNKYCVLALLVLFHTGICVSDLLKDKDTENKFKHTLKLCGLPENTPPAAIGDYLKSLKGCFVKTLGDTYQFNHDFVMEVTTQVFGTDYPAEIIKYADIGFLRRRVRLEDSEIHNDSFNIYLNERYIEELGERLFTELIKERFLDVVLNPCLRNEKVIKVLKKKIVENPRNIQMFIKTKKVTIDEQEADDTSQNLLLTKLSFLDLENEVSPLFALTVFCHTQISQCCLNTLQHMHSGFRRHNFPLNFTKLFYKPKQINFLTCYFLAVCCNGSTELFDNVFKNATMFFLTKSWGVLFPIHIIALFHNYQLLFKIIKIDVDVNLKTNGKGGWTPLTLAAGNNTREHGDYNHEESGSERRDKTVQLLLKNGADINLCLEDGVSPLYLACQNGHDSTVQLLLSNGADINLCKENGVSPLHIACENGHDSIVQLLLNKGANTNLCTRDGASPLCTACQNGHDSIVQLLLSNGADNNL